MLCAADFALDFPKVFSVNWMIMQYTIHNILVFIGRTDTEAETPVLWPPHAKS